MNAIDLLISEHNKVRDILKKIAEDSKSFDEKKNSFKTLRHDLLRHEKMEQTIWYPHFKDSDKLDKTVKHLIKEEKEAHQEIQDLNQIGSEEEWNTQFKKFKHDVEHHAHEEESKLFPQIRNIFSESELANIGKEMLQFEKEYDAK
jgi:hemerythrin-like domain-containing protein